MLCVQSLKYPISTNIIGGQKPNAFLVRLGKTAEVLPPLVVKNKPSLKVS